MAYCAYCGSSVAQVSNVPCASCGKPTNGAPPRAAKGMNPGVLVLAVIAAALGVLMVIGILAAIAIPNLLTAMQRSKQKRTIADIRTVATAIDAYATDNRAYPAGSSIADLEPHLAPKYIRTLPRLDGWGTELRYAANPGGGYTLISAGADKSFDERDPAGETRHADCDIVFSNGDFVQYPENTIVGGN